MDSHALLCRFVCYRVVDEDIDVYNSDAYSDGCEPKRKKLKLWRAAQAGSHTERTGSAGGGSKHERSDDSDSEEDTGPVLAMEDADSEGGEPNEDDKPEEHREYVGWHGLRACTTWMSTTSSLSNVACRWAGSMSELRHMHMCILKLFLRF